MQLMIADNYEEFAKRLNGLMQTKKISKKVVADKIGKSYEMVRRYGKALSMPDDEETMSLLAEAVGSTAKYLRYGIESDFQYDEPQSSQLQEIREDRIKAHKLAPDKKCAFKFIDVKITPDGNSELVTLGTYHTPFTASELYQKGIDHSQCRMVAVEGKSMHKVFSPGDVVCIDMSKTRVIEAAPYAVMDGNLLRIRYLIERGDGSLILRSENQTAFPDEIIEKENREDRIKIIGAIWWSAKLWV